MNIPKLIKAIKRKDRKAQRALVDFLSPLLYTIGLRYMKNSEDAKDVLQDALLLVFKNIDQYRIGSGQLKSWASRITINVAISKFRKSAWSKEIFPGQLTEETQEPMVLENLNFQDLIGLVNRLPHLQNQVFNLYIIDGYSHQEIAELLGMKESYSRTVLARARKKLQELVLESKKIRS